ncbi:adenylyl-sulfate kinase [Paraburkholderia phymatum]|uniref:adenylyl-sulfate kinase n=1 Tax=Paraburkholderia phymatum TaxID=148447 RepID=UPI0031803CB3
MGAETGIHGTHEFAHVRVVTCGAVDDGKSSLIGRLLYDMGLLTEEVATKLEQGGGQPVAEADPPNFAWILDGLTAEREQGITIDVAYRCFTSGRRRFTVLDAPGHPQYTRNMVTGASDVDIAVLVIDARRGTLPQTRRHSHLVSMLGVRQVVAVVNKMDLVGYGEHTFRDICAELSTFVAPLRFEHMTCLPVSAAYGDNVTTSSTRMPWYRGPTFLDVLESADTCQDRRNERPLRLPVQWVCRPGRDFRGYAGTVCSGAVRVGDAVHIAPSGRASTVARIVTADGDIEQAVSGQAVQLTLRDEIDVSRGSVFSSASHPVSCADQFECELVWMDDGAGLPGRDYLLKLATNTVNAQITDIKYEIDVIGGSHLAARQLAANSLAVCNIALDQRVPFEPYRDNRALGAFVLIDRVSHRTVAAGMLHFALHRSRTLQTRLFDVDKGARSALKHQRACVVWLTGYSGSGKSTIANALEKRLVSMGYHTYLLDGENVRHGLSKDLGFDPAARVENVRRAAEVARLMVDAGLIVIAAFVSPFRAERERARKLVAHDEFIEVFVDTPLEVAERRDPRGLYRRARSGELKNFAGISLDYEPPLAPDVHIDTNQLDAAGAVESIVAVLCERQAIVPHNVSNVG